MRLLVLGGTQFVGRAVVDDALSCGWSVSALNRGVTGELPVEVEALVADRTSESELRAALGNAAWDMAVDTWSGAPETVAIAARELRGHVRRFGYVSSVSVYEWGRHVDESSPMVDAGTGDYAANKRGGELAALESFPDALLARAGLILGPHEDIGRLPWWLNRIAEGGAVVAPGRAGRPLQYVDARDLASWLLTGLADGLTGAVDVISPSGHASTEDLLAACIGATGSAATLKWFSEAELDAAGAQPWTELPCWVPEAGEFAGFLESDTRLAGRTGLTCRSVQDTVDDTWEWLRSDGAAAQRGDRPVHGLRRETEQRLLADR